MALCKDYISGAVVAHPKIAEVRVREGEIPTVIHQLRLVLLYGLETFRGANSYLDAVAQDYKTYFTVDWPTFDQLMPRCITDVYYQRFLPRLICTSHSYQPTYEVLSNPDLNPTKFTAMMRNLLSFLHTWFNNLTFDSTQGYAYRRQLAGILSGLFNTQYIDSFCNLFVVIDAMIEYGFTDDEIRYPPIYYGRRQLRIYTS